MNLPCALRMLRDLGCDTLIGGSGSFIKSEFIDLKYHIQLAELMEETREHSTWEVLPRIGTGVYVLLGPLERPYYVFRSRK